MTNSDLYQDIATRTGGSLFVGVLGPVRTGKSTFIKRFMETCVIPNIDNVYRRERAIDELPQSGSGRTIMTAEPKFVPEEAVDIPWTAGPPSRCVSSTAWATWSRGPWASLRTARPGWS